MENHTLDLEVLPSLFSICQLAWDAPLPEWSQTGELIAMVRTREELSLVCPTHAVPPHIQAQGPWRAIKIRGPLDFSQVGILLTLLTPLAHAAISVFALSTYNTDYVFVPAEHLDTAIQVLKDAGHRIHRG